MTRAAFLCIAALTVALPHACGDPPAKPATAIAVEEHRLTFDPRRCTAGMGQVFWALGSFRVTVVGHREGRCVFDYRWEVEGAGAYQVHRVRVPLDSGPVVIDAVRKDADPKRHWSYVYTSFTKDQAMLIRSAGHGWVEDRIEGTEYFVAYLTHRTGSPVQPAKPGDPVTFRFTVYTGEAFDRLAPRAKQGQTVTLTEGKSDGWAWVRAASAGMAPREVRRVRLPARVAEGARSWQPDLAKEAKLFLEMERIPAPGK